MTSDARKQQLSINLTWKTGKETERVTAGAIYRQHNQNRGMKWGAGQSENKRRKYRKGDRGEDRGRKYRYRQNDHNRVRKWDADQSDNNGMNREEEKWSEQDWEEDRRHNGQNIEGSRDAGQCGKKGRKRKINEGERTGRQREGHGKKRITGKKRAQRGRPPKKYIYRMTWIVADTEVPARKSERKASEQGRRTFSGRQRPSEYDTDRV